MQNSKEYTQFDNEDEENSGSTDIISFDDLRKKMIFIMFVFVSMMLNFDTGVFPSSLNIIQEDMNLTTYEIAVLGIYLN